MSEDPELTPRAVALPLAVEEAAHAAEVRARVRGFMGHLNAVIAGVLPEGTRFEWPSSSPPAGGMLTPEIIGSSLDALWSPARPGGRPGAKPFAGGSMEISGTIAVEFFPGAAEALLEMFRPRCGALLFPLPPRAPVPVEPVHPLDAPYFAPVQGPQPAACALDKDHRIGWHWCDGTWWKA